MLVFSPFALWHLFAFTCSSSLHHTCVNRRDRLVSVFTICSMAPALDTEGVTSREACDVSWWAHTHTHARKHGGLDTEGV